MLILKLYNTLEGTNENAVYRYAVFINDVQIVEGEVSGHNRNDGWAELVRGIAQHHLTPRVADGFQPVPNSNLEVNQTVSAKAVVVRRRR